MGHEKDTRVSDKVTNTQPYTITYSKTLTDIQEDQPNKGATKKSMIQQTLLQSYTPEKDRVHWMNQLLNEILWTMWEILTPQNKIYTIHKKQIWISRG